MTLDGFHPDTSTKWICCVSSHQPVYEAAHLILEARLQPLPYWLPLAAERWAESHEFVHQLRVSTRRAVEALRIFSDVMRTEHHKAMRNTLRRIRRAADEARNLDVLHERFVNLAEVSQLQVCHRVIDDIQKRRTNAQEPIIAICTELDANRFFKDVVHLLEHVRSKRNRPARRTFGQQAPRYLKPTLKEFFKASKLDLVDDDALHELRIRVKKLRYTIELLAELFPPELREELYPQLVALQDSMGAVNDRATARQVFCGWLGDCKDAEQCSFLRDIMHTESSAQNDLRNSFLDSWPPHAMRGLRSQFKQVLKKYQSANRHSRKSQ